MVAVAARLVPTGCCWQMVGCNSPLPPPKRLPVRPQEFQGLVETGEEGWRLAVDKELARVGSRCETRFVAYLVR